jgi:hypothetical protein
MTSPARPAGAPRFVAYSTMTRMPALVGTDAASLLVEARSIPALGYDNRFVEVLDCGAQGPDAGTVDVPLDAARSLYRTVFRGSGALGQPGMPPLPLQDPLPTPPDRAALKAIEDGLSSLTARARAAGLDGLASALGRVLDDARAEIAARLGPS